MELIGGNAQNLSLAIGQVKSYSACMMCKEKKHGKNFLDSQKSVCPCCPPALFNMPIQELEQSVICFKRTGNDSRQV